MGVEATWGADVEALEHLGRDLEAAAEHLASLQRRIRARIHSSPWAGGDAARFVAEWDGVHRGVITAAESALRLAGQAVRGHAAEQRTASAADAAVAVGAATAAGAAGAAAGTMAGVIAGAATTDGYVVGPATTPKYTWDEDFVYGSKNAGPKDFVSAAEWKGKMEGARVLRPDLDDALTAYGHYWDNTGTPLTFDAEEAVREDAAVRANLEQEIARTRSAVDELVAQGATSFSISGPGHATTQYPETENWQKAIGAYQQWSSADVQVVDGSVHMKVVVHLEDRYNFNRGAADIASAAPDDANGRFTEIGWAKPFDSHGTVIREVVWPLGEDPPATSGQGSETRDLGGEDRIDGRGGTSIRG